MLADIAFNGMLCLAGVYFARYHSMDAFRAAFALMLGWLFYVSAWIPDNSPHFVIKRELGWDISSVELWSLCDCLVGLYILSLAWDKWWGLTLWASFTVQCCLHILRINEVFDFALYSSILDKIFLGQIVVFLFLGWPNVRNNISDIIAGWRDAPDKVGTALRKEKR